MRLNSTLTLACFIALASPVRAQTPPSSGLPRALPMPIQPKPTGNTPIQPTPTGRTTPPRVYPPAQYQMNGVGTVPQFNQGQINRLNGVIEQVQGQYAPLPGNPDTLGDAAQFGRIQELNQQLSAAWNRNAAQIFDANRLPSQPLNQPLGGLITVMDPDAQKQFDLSPEQARRLQDNADWSTRRYSVIAGTGATDATKGLGQYGDYWKHYPERFDRLMTPEQPKGWRERTGDPYPLQPNFSQIR